MGKRTKDVPQYLNGRRVVGAKGAAAILTRRAHDLGIPRTYSRDTIYRDYRLGKLIAAVEAPAGNIYYVDDVEAVPISPHVGAPSGVPHKRPHTKKVP